MSLKIGIILDNRYKIQALLGHGGMSEVYEATDLITRDSVAIKMMKSELVNSKVNLQRFENEAFILSSLEHKSITKVYSHGTYEGRPYMANEYVKGQALNEALDFRSSLPINEALSYMLQITDALKYAHAHNVIHRDIKPDNIFILSDGSIKLGDFGIAQAEGFDAKSSDKEVMGSINYIAPEILLNKPATRQSDIYSAGVTFFELITGHVPFEMTDIKDIASAHINEKFPSPKKYLPNCPKEIERIIFKATKKDPKERYLTMDAFYEDLYNAKANPDVAIEKKGFFSRLFGFK